jgi:hypothetical protein
MKLDIFVQGEVLSRNAQGKRVSSVVILVFSQVQQKLLLDQQNFLKCKNFICPMNEVLDKDFRRQKLGD